MSRHGRTASRTRTRRVLLAVVALAVTGLVGTGLALWMQGYRLYVVHTGSMAPHLVPGDVVVDRPDRAPRVGEVITFRHSDLTSDVVTHRVVGVSAAGIRTKGDANRTADVWTIRPDQVRGRTVWRLPGAGYLVVYLRQPEGLLSVATAALGLLLLWELFFPASPAPRHTSTITARAERPGKRRDRSHMIAPRTSRSAG